MPGFPPFFRYIRTCGLARFGRVVCPFCPSHSCQTHSSESGPPPSTPLHYEGLGMSFTQAPKVTDLVACPGPHRPSLLWPCHLSGESWSNNWSLFLWKFQPAPSDYFSAATALLHPHRHRNPKLSSLPITLTSNCVAQMSQTKDWVGF